MGGLSTFGAALALVQAFEREGVVHTLAPDRLTVTAKGAPPAHLVAQQRAFLGDSEQRKSLPPYRALRAIVGAPSLMAREVLTLPVAGLRSYPLAYTARFTCKGVTGAWSTSRAEFTRLVATKVPAFSAVELEAAALAVELGRAAPADMVRWLASKSRGGDWKLTLGAAHVEDMPAYCEGMRTALCVGELLDALGCEIGPVEIHEPKEGGGA